MKTLHGVLFALFILGTISCGKKTPKPEDPPIVYNYKTYTYIGNTFAQFDTTTNNITTSWDTAYVDSVIVKIDSIHDKIIFTANEHNPLGVYPQTAYDFDISSNYFRKTFIQNHYQQFNFEGDTLKSYYFKLNAGSGISYQKIIAFAGSLKP